MVENSRQENHSNDFPSDVLNSTEASSLGYGSSVGASSHDNDEILGENTRPSSYDADTSSDAITEQGAIAMEGDPGNQLAVRINNLIRNHTYAFTIGAIGTGYLLGRYLVSRSSDSAVVNDVASLGYQQAPTDAMM